MDIKSRISKLREELNQHNINYYVYDNPTISDSKYDILLDELEVLENKYPEYLLTFLPLKILKSIQKKPLSKIAISDFFKEL